jgi:hypothetical protein
MAVGRGFPARLRRGPYRAFRTRMPESVTGLADWNRTRTKRASVGGRSMVIQLHNTGRMVASALTDRDADDGSLVGLLPNQVDCDEEHSAMPAAASG